MVTGNIKFITLRMKYPATAWNDFARMKSVLEGLQYLTFYWQFQLQQNLVLRLVMQQDVFQSVYI
jgi:hypothetical protein